ncbi:Oxygen sensor histidine kinase NreB [compost metagenome]
MSDFPDAALILDAIPLACYMLDNNVNFCYVNDKALSFFKMSREAMLGKNVWTLFPNSIETDYYHEINAALTQKKAKTFEYISIYTDSWLKLTVTPIKEGVIVTFNCIEQDKYNENLYKTLVENTPDIVTKWDSNLKLSYGNVAFEEKLELSLNDTIGKTHEQIWPETDLNALVEKMQKVLDNGSAETITVPLKTQDSQLFYNVKMAPELTVNGKVKSIISIGRDITELKASQEAINADISSKYKSLFNSINQGFCIIDLLWDADDNAIDYKFLEVNPAFCKLTGITETHKTIREIYPEAESYWFKIYGEVAKSKKSAHFELPAKLIDGWYEIEAFPIKSLGENIVGVLFNDITERKHAENILRKSEERQSYLLKLTDAIRFISDPLEIQEAAATVIAKHLDADNAFYGDIININDVDYIQVGRLYQKKGKSGSFKPNLYSFSDFGKHIEEIKHGKTSVVANIETDDRFSAEELSQYRVLGFYAWVAIPLIKNGKAVGLFMVQNFSPYEWTEQHLTFIEETAERTWAYAEQTKIAKALSYSQEQLAVALTASNMSTFHWLKKKNDIVVSPLSPIVFGLKNKNTSYSESEGFYMIHPEDQKKHLKTLENASKYQNEFHQVYRIIRPIDGKVAWIEERGKGIYHQHSGIFEIRGIHWDITAQKESEDIMRNAEEKYLTKLAQDVDLRTKELKDSKDELEAIYNNTLMSMSVLNPVRNKYNQITDFKIALTNKALEKETGRDDLIGKLYAEEFPGIKKAGLFELMLKVMETGLPQTSEYFYPYEDFNKWYSCMFVKMGDNLLATNQDISERKIAEQLSSDNSAMIQGIANSAPDMLYAISLDTLQQFYSNNRIEQLVEKTHAEIKKMGKHFFEEFIHPDDKKQFYTTLKEFKSEHQKKEIKELSYRLVDAKGKIHWIKTKSAVYIRDEEGFPTHIVGISQDITQQRELEEKNKQLTNERRELEKQQQKEILKATLNAQEEERQRIAESLHNGLGQVLYGVKATLERLDLDNVEAIDENINILNRSKELLGMCIQESRKISHELMPSILEDFGLKVSIKDICNQLKGKTHFNCTFSDVDVPMDKYVQLAIYRIVQELSLNIMKHADASLAHIDISIIDGQIHIMAKDNGKGFERDIVKNKGIGLKTIESKVKLLNGKIAIASKPSETIIRIQLPL